MWPVVKFIFATLVLPSILVASASHLHLTALITRPSGAAAFECWRIKQPFAEYPTVGSAITGLADVSNVSYVVLPPRSEEGLHKPPHAMFFILLSGLAHVTLPSKPEGEGLYIMEGVNPLMIAADYWGEGHFTAYPSDKQTVALQVPFTDGEMPEHEVVGEGICGGGGGDGRERLGLGLGREDQQVVGGYAG